MRLRGTEAPGSLSMRLPAVPEESASPSNRRPLPAPPARLWQHARKETSGAEAGHERRRDRRYSLITSVLAVPVDGKHRPIGTPFVALSSGMSVTGIRLIHTAAAPSKFLLLEFEGQSARFVLSVLRSRPIGDCYEIAGRLTKPRRSAPDASAIYIPTASASLVESDEAHPLSAATDDVLHWAGVSAAAQLLVTESKASRL
jgi:hypothetical protein